MSVFFNPTPNSHPAQLAEHTWPTYNNEAGWYFSDHEGEADVKLCSTPTSHYPIDAPVTSASGIHAGTSVPSRRTNYSRRRDPNYIPRPRNAFIFFRSAYIDSVRESKQPQQNELSKNAANIWNRMSPEEKQPFFDLAAVEKEQHYAKFPDYVYSPIVKPGSPPKLAGTRKTNTAPRSLEKKRKTPGPSEHIPSLSPTLAEQPALSRHHGQKFASIEREPPSAFHAHLDHITSQFAYQQYTHDLVATSMPTLPYASSLYNSHLGGMDMPFAPALHSSAHTYEATASYSCDTTYPSVDPLASLDYMFPDGGLEGDLVLQQYLDELANMANTTPSHFPAMTQNQDTSVYQFFGFSMGA